MNIDEFLILNAARPRGQDDSLPDVAAALNALEAEPLERAWLAALRAQDSSLGRSLRSIDPPASLDAKIASLLKGPQPRARSAILKRRPLLGWAAASIASLITGSLIYKHNRLSLQTLISTVCRLSSSGVTLSLMSMDKATVSGWLTQNAAPRAAHLPPALDSITRKGCHLYEIKSRIVSLECFILPTDMRELHLFTIANTGLADPLPPGSPPLVLTHSASQQTFAHWSDSNHTMVLVSQETPAFISTLLANS